MKQSIESKIILKLYEAFFEGESSYGMYQIQEELRLDEVPFWNIVDRLDHKNIVKAHAGGGFYKITPSGIIYAENQSIAPEQLKAKNRQIRTKTLELLEEIYSIGGIYSDIAYEEIAQKCNLDPNDVVYNLMILDELGYVEARTGITYSITHKGLDSVEDWKNKILLVEELERITKFKPQQRGRELQKLIAKVIEQQGWYQEEGGRTSNEEMDVIVFQGREYYLLESKWEKKPIEAPVARELYGKLGNRADVRGILVSMSNFTAGTEKQVIDYVNEKVILLFGEKDIRSMITWEKTFEDLLNHKYRELVIRKKVVFE